MLFSAFNDVLHIFVEIDSFSTLHEIVHHLTFQKCLIRNLQINDLSNNLEEAWYVLEMQSSCGDTVGISRL